MKSDALCYRDGQRRGVGAYAATFRVMSGRADLCEALLDKGAPIDCGYVQHAPHFTMIKGNTPLAVAGQYARDSTIIDLLLRRGADPRQHIDEFGLTALHFTCTCGNVNGIRALSAHDETLLEVRNGHGELPFTLAACFTGQPRMLETLRDEFPKLRRNDQEARRGQLRRAEFVRQRYR